MLRPRTSARYTALRVALALGSLVSMLLAAGAGNHWQ
jgi:hypothetical protein